MKTMLISLILIIGFNSCNLDLKNGKRGEIIQKGNIENEATINIDSVNYVILPYDSSMHWIFPQDYKSADLSKEEITQLESILANYMDGYNQEALKKFYKLDSENPSYNFRKADFIIRLKKYTRQYIPVNSPDGEKMIYINAFCTQQGHDYWRTGLVEVLDGGNCYFQIKINLTTKEVIEFSVNGVA